MATPLLFLVLALAVTCRGQMTPFHPFISAVSPSLVPVATWAVAPPMASQYHAQDELGQASFGYAHPGQAASNFRDALGNQIGSWAYIDPNGNEVRVSYVADSNGFRVLSNALPVGPQPLTSTIPAVVQPVVDTPEVAEARRAHLAAVADAKARNAAAAAVESIKSRQRRSPHHNGRYYSSPKSKGQQYYRPKSSGSYYRYKPSRPVVKSIPAAPVVKHVETPAPIVHVPAPVIHVPAPVVHHVEHTPIVHVPAPIVQHTVHALPQIQSVPVVHPHPAVHTLPAIHTAAPIVHDIPVVHALPVHHPSVPVIPAVPGVEVAAIPSVAISKYHSQDELGQASYGHVTADQSASNFRDINGNQIGHYAYINPDGQQIVVYYTAGTGGFRVMSNALPEAPSQTAAVEETEEVAEARRIHMALVEEARNRIKSSTP